MLVLHFHFLHRAEGCAGALLAVSSLVVGWRRRGRHDERVLWAPLEPDHVAWLEGGCLARVLGIDGELGPRLAADRVQAGYAGEDRRADGDHDAVRRSGRL